MTRDERLERRAAYWAERDKLSAKADRRLKVQGWLLVIADALITAQLVYCFVGFCH